MIRWNVPGYVVAFTTREGGVSTGQFASLNLGGRDDAPARIAENRRLACEELGLDPAGLAVNRQRHSTVVNRAGRAVRDAYGDGLWTEEPDLPMLALAADCVPLAIAATDGRRALAVVHAGWRGLAAGVVTRAVEELGASETAAIVGPAIGPCCYEVGAEVSEHFDGDLTHDGHLDLWEAAERALRRAGVATVERVDLCTQCNADRFFSYRRMGASHGAHGVLGAIER